MTLVDSVFSCSQSEWQHVLQVVRKVELPLYTPAYVQGVFLHTLGYPAPSTSGSESVLEESNRSSIISNKVWTLSSLELARGLICLFSCNGPLGSSLVRPWGSLSLAFCFSISASFTAVQRAVSIMF